MIDLCSDKSTCCGCGACKTVCPKHAISMESDDEGFIYPNIDRKLCIECHLCEKICAFKNTEVLNKKPLQSYVGINRNSKDLHKSASGGVFAAIAKYILENNGVIVGCSWNEELNPEHIIIDNYEALYRLQGSKYVQSDTEDIFLKTKNILKNNGKVFFTGTPCQVNEMRQYLGRDYDKLLTADLICHGVPNKEFFNAYKNWYEKKNKCTIQKINFRDKSISGWGSVGTITYKKNNKIKRKIISYREDPYYYLFEYGYFLRESCYKCKYSCSDRKGDVTLGDFWGVKKYFPDLNHYDGVSAILVNTKKGNEITNKLSKYIRLVSTEYEYIEKNNDKLRHSSIQPKDRKEWLKYYKIGGFDLIAKRFYKQNYKNILISRVKRCIPRKLKDLIKKIIKH